MKKGARMKPKTKLAIRTIIDQTISEYGVNEKFDAGDVMQVLDSRYVHDISLRKLEKYIRCSAYCEAVTPNGSQPMVYRRVKPIVCEGCGRGMIFIDGYGYRCNVCHISLKIKYTATAISEE